MSKKPYLDFDKSMFILRNYSSALESKAIGIGFKHKHQYGVYCTLPQTAYQLRKYATDKCNRAFKFMQWHVKKSRQTTGVKLNFPINGELYPFQEAGAEYICKSKVAFLADEMGLGKTIQVLAAISHIKPARTLIICPSGLRDNWQKEFSTWLPEYKTHIISNGKEAVPDTQVLIISYDMIKKINIKSQLMRYYVPFDFIALDEAHYLKNRRSQRTKEVLGFRGKAGVIVEADRIVAMSGTPLVNRPAELWPLIMRVFNSRFPECFMDYELFTKYFCGAFMLRNIWMDTGATNLMELRHLLRQRFLIRREKKQVLKQLPDKIYTLYDVQPDKEAQKALYEEKEYRASAITALKKGKLPPLEELSELRRILGVSKVKHVVEWIKDTIESGVDKIVIFAHHRDAITLLVKELKSYNPVVIHGGVTAKKRTEAVEAFQSNKKVKVFIGSITAAGEGITLTAASHVVFAEIDWVPGRNEQAIDRLHRIGQKGTVNAYFFIYEESLDAYILKRSLQKQANIKKVLA